MKNNNEASREELIRYIEVLTKKNEALEEFIDKKYTKAINYTHSCTELPNIYEKEFNSERIKIINTLSENYNVDKSTVRSLFCDGADWYKQKLTK